MQVSIIGSGNISWFLARTLSQNFEVTVHHRSELDHQWSQIDGLQFTHSKKIPSSCQWTLLAVSDHAIPNVLKDFEFDISTTVLHVSGAVSINVFSNYRDKNFGILYPLQSISKGIMPDKVPVLIEADSTKTIQKIRQLTPAISNQVRELNSNDRAKVHLAAVFASNFVNHHLTIAELILNKVNFPLSLLDPLIQSTIFKALHNGPFKSQTGPAVRKDQQTMDKHVQLLDESEILELYQSISRHIQTHHAK
jgi:predicted short-subunit dehydrogenase-like oxidoreductase (DUF2520 family)